MKTGKTLALTLGSLAAGAVVAVLVTGRNERKTRSYDGFFKNQPGIKLASKYDDSEVCYI